MPVGTFPNEIDKSASVSCFSAIKEPSSLSRTATPDGVLQYESFKRWPPRKHAVRLSLSHSLSLSLPFSCSFSSISLSLCFSLHLSVSLALSPLSLSFPFFLSPLSLSLSLSLTTLSRISHCLSFSCFYFTASLSLTPLFLSHVSLSLSLTHPPTHPLTHSLPSPPYTP